MTQALIKDLRAIADHLAPNGLLDVAKSALEFVSSFASFAMIGALLVMFS